MSADVARPKGARPRICYVVSSEITVAAFLRDQIRSAAALYDVSVVVNTGNPDFLSSLGLDAELHPVRIERPISPMQDLRALGTLYRLFRAGHYALVHSVSPKAGLLAMLAAFMARVRCRVHTFTGQVWVTRTGFKRFFLKSVDRLLAALTTHALVDSHSQRSFLIAQRIVSEGKSTVLGEGSISGVDNARFRPDPEARRRTRDELGIEHDGVVFIYVGRLNLDKGVLDLAAAYADVHRGSDRVWLLFVGPDEEGLLPQIRDLCGAAYEHVRDVGYTVEPERYIAAADVFVLPSYREGFGTAVMEAAACGLPAVATRIYGVTDAVIDGITGLLYEPGDRKTLADALSRFADAAQLRQQMGEAARARALASFSATSVTAALLAFYAKILN